MKKNLIQKISDIFVLFTVKVIVERRISECVRGLRGDEMLIQQGLYFASPLSWLASVFFRCLPALQSVLVQISINANGTSHDTCVQKIINNKIKQPESKPFWGWFMLRWTYYLRCRLKMISWYFIESCANDICYGVEENTEQGSVSDNISISMLLTSCAPLCWGQTILRWPWEVKYIAT